MDWIDRLAIQDTLESLLQHHSSRASVLECEVKWAVENITTNKASGGDGILTELFKILKDDAIKVCLYILLLGTSLVAQMVKNPPAVREIWVRSLGWEDPLEKGKATHSSVLAWRIPWTV